MDMSIPAEAGIQKDFITGFRIKYGMTPDCFAPITSGLAMVREIMSG
jgi:hypothetical protein